jgi:nucleoside-diphosphate-sugar epimerase
MGDILEKSIGVYGATGFIGRAFCKQSTNTTFAISRHDLNPMHNEILYCIGTNDNYNVFTDPTLDIRTNQIVLINKLENLRKKSKHFTLNYLSSWTVYGNIPIPFSEENFCKPSSFNSISKYAAELLLKSYCETFDINYRIIRLANVVGPGNVKYSEKRNALQFLANKLKNNDPIHIYDNGNFYRDYIHINDVVKALDLVIDSKLINQVINIGSGDVPLFRDLIFTLKYKLNSTSEILSIDPPNFHKVVQSANSILDIAKLKSIGFKSEYSVIEGILEQIS